MTALPEAKLAREAEICYATLAFVTDYDCWHQSHESVTIEMVIGNLQRNVEVAKKILKRTVTQIPERRECPCATALKDAIITSPERIPGKMKRELALLIGKYVK
jgi:5'-methylthioadenosine phosphorylase